MQKRVRRRRVNLFIERRLNLYFILRRQIGIFHKHRDCHGSDSTWNGSYETHRLERLEISIASNFSIYESESYVNNSCSRANHIFSHQSGTSRSDDDDIGIFGKLCDIFCFFITHYHCSSCIHKEK